MGEFGVIRKGAVKIGPNYQAVAVKMMNCNADLDTFARFLVEPKIMAYVGEHRNVVRLVAACTQNIDRST